MWIHLLILGVTLGFSAAYNIDMAAWYETNIAYIAGAQAGLCVQALIAACVFILVSVIMAQMNAHSLMLPLSRLILEISLFGVSIVAFGALYISWTLLKNVWVDMGVAVIVPFIGVVAAGICLQLFDFNYPYKQKILGYFIVSMFSVVLVFLRLM
ncbi:MAG: hypothetical protein ABFS09_05560 [Thermodesulfobacteriota bacterium]